MIDIKKLAPGMTVWDVRPGRRRAFSHDKWETFPVEIVAVSIEDGWVDARWNYNPVRRRYARKGKLPWRAINPNHVKAAPKGE